jgi:hypothetical protein
VIEAISIQPQHRIIKPSIAAADIPAWYQCIVGQKPAGDVHPVGSVISDIRRKSAIFGIFTAGRRIPMREFHGTFLCYLICDTRVGYYECRQQDDRDEPGPVGHFSRSKLLDIGKLPEFERNGFRFPPCIGIGSGGTFRHIVARLPNQPLPFAVYIKIYALSSAGRLAT